MRVSHAALALAAGLGLALSGLVGPSQAQQAPSGRTITIIVPIAPGGAVDSSARLMAEKLQERLGEPVVVENRPGAGGVIGVSAVTRAEPDGRTLLMMASSTVTHRWLQKDVPYDILTDIVPIARVATTSLALFAHPSVPANDVKGLIELARKPNHGLTVSLNGVGTPHHLANLLLKSQAKIDLPEVAYRGTGPGIPDFLAGRVPLMWATPVALVSLLQAGKIKTLGVASPERASLLPDVPTIAENALPGFRVEIWTALAAPAGTPPEIMERYAKALEEIVALPDIKERGAKLGMDMGYVHGKVFSKTVAEDHARFGKLVQDAGIALK